MAPHTFGWLFGWTPLDTSFVGLACAALGLLAGWLIYARGRTHPQMTPAPDKTAETDYAGQDRRVFPRFEGCQLKLTISAPRHADLLEGTVLNYSMGGVCVWTTHQLETGTTLRVRNSEHPQTAVWVTVVVRNCRLQRGGWSLGCQYVEAATANKDLFGLQSA